MGNSKRRQSQRRPNSSVVSDIRCLHYCSGTSLNAVRTGIRLLHAAENLMDAVRLRASSRCREPGPGWVDLTLWCGDVQR